MDERLIHRRGPVRAPQQRVTPEPEPLDLNPRSVYEVVTRQMLEALSADVQAMRERVDALFFLAIASIVVDLVLRLAGRG
jgi:hypothetical protein